LRELRWRQIDLVQKKQLTVGKSNTDAGTGRVIPLNDTVMIALESGAGDEVIMSIAGHVPRAMLSRYSHVRMEAKRRALDETAARQNGADEKRKVEANQDQHDEVILQAVQIQC
jgi:hypothetical protein